MIDSALNELKSVFQNLTTSMTEADVTELRKRINTFFDELAIERLAREEQIDKIFAILSENKDFKGRKEDVALLVATLNAGNLPNKSERAKSDHTKTKRPAKYEYHDETGALKTWCGTGRKPFALTKLIDDGNALDSYLIVKEPSWDSASS